MSDGFDRTEPLGVALVGCAHTSHAWAYARALTASPNARLVGVFDPDPALTRPIVDDFDAHPAQDLQALLASSEVEAVVVCSATSEHRALVELAAAHGRHVLCEKPIATTVADATAMIESCAAAGVQLHMAFVTRFHPLVQQVRAALHDNELGEVISVVAGNRGRPPLPPSYPAWITDQTMAGGGALIDHSVHLTDVLRHLLGREVRTVAAEVDSRMWGLDVDDLALLSLVFDGGVVASLDPSWSVPKNNPWDYDFFLRVLGTRGALTIDDLGPSLQLVSPSWGEGLRLVPFGADVDALLIEAFVASVRSGRREPPCADGLDGLRALEVALAGYAAARRRGPVSLPSS